MSFTTTPHPPLPDESNLASLGLHLAKWAGVSLFTFTILRAAMEFCRVFIGGHLYYYSHYEHRVEQSWKQRYKAHMAKTQFITRLWGFAVYTFTFMATLGYFGQHEVALTPRNTLLISVVALLLVMLVHFVGAAVVYGVTIPLNIMEMLVQMFSRTETGEQDGADVESLESQSSS